MKWTTKVLLWCQFQKCWSADYSLTIAKNISPGEHVNQHWRVHVVPTAAGVRSSKWHKLIR
jgi:hypothetical protein